MSRGAIHYVPAILLALVVFGLAWAGAGDCALLDVDEPRFAAASREIAAGGDPIVPQFNGRDRYDKPILVYWCQALAMRGLGAGERAARLPSAAGVALAAAATFAAGRTLGLGVGPSWFAGLVLGTNLLVLVLGHASTADALLLGLVSWVLAAQLARWRGRRNAWSWLGLWGGLGLAFLTKGPPALVVPGALALGCLRAGARPRPRSYVPGALLAAGLVLAWGIPALVRTGGGFVTEGLGHHVLARSLRPFEGHGGFAPWWYLFYGLSIPLTFLPWSYFAPRILAALRRDHGLPAGAGRVLSWGIGGTVLVFTLVTSKMVHYVLPVYPLLALALAAGLSSEAPPPGSRARAGLAATGAVAVLGFPAAALALGLNGGLALAALAAGLCLGGGMLLAGQRAARAWQPLFGIPRPAWFLALAALLSGGILGARGLPAFDRDLVIRHALPPLRTVLAEAPPDRPLYRYGIVMPSLVYYLDRPLRRVPRGEARSSEEACLRILRRGAWVLTRGRRLAILRRAAAGADPAVRALLARPLLEIDGFWPSRGRFETLVLLGRRGG